jgi:TonB-dependent SusC/RagA subfamily outer membrane receptor
MLMRKLFLFITVIALLSVTAGAQQKSFDQKVQLKTCNIKIEANPFVATTVMELEFYNPQDKEVEGLQYFELNKGQVVTDFQLELNGKYREGSIEERWKANRAYSSIVGKRIDPAILQMDYQDHYSLRIYPIAAHSSRKVSVTIKQLMKDENGKISYYFPLNFPSVTGEFSIDTRVTNAGIKPNTGEGFLEASSFNYLPDIAWLKLNKKNILLDKVISFFIPVAANMPLKCISKNNDETNFLLKIKPSIQATGNTGITTLTIFWDVSLSGKERKIGKELDFLEDYITQNSITNLKIVLFNQRIQGVINYIPAEVKFSFLRKKLEEYNYTGATDLGNLDFYKDSSDAIFLFSDGRNSLGYSLPKPGAAPVSCIASSQSSDMNSLKTIVGTTGGKLIDFRIDKVNIAIAKIEKGENFLMRYKTRSNGIIVKGNFPLKMGSAILLKGNILHSDVLSLEYGNNSKTIATEEFLLDDEVVCDENTYKDVKMLCSYDSLINLPYNYYRWPDFIVFGLNEKVVTIQTSFLVLERIEDYIKYNIAPPKELEEKCAEMNYVYRSEYKIRQLKTFTEQEILQGVVNNYNLRVRWWNKDEKLISLLTPPEVEKTEELNEVDAKQAVASLQKSGSTTLPFNEVQPDGNNGLKEVVVTGAFGIKRTARSVSSSVQIVYADQIQNVREVNVNNILAGKVAGIQVRSQSAAKLGAETSIRLRGENGLGIGAGALYVVDGTIMPDVRDINTNDIEDITVLQGPAASALFGPDGANGAIVITNKKARRTYYYSSWVDDKLSNLEDVDYMQEIKKSSAADMWDTYKELQQNHENEAGFYFDMVNHFFANKRPEQAMEIMYDGIEACNDNAQSLRAAAYVLESWKKFDDALYIYKKLSTDHPYDISIQRDMALAYFQKGSYQNAVDTYYAIILKQSDNEMNVSIKEQALAEMNAIIAVQKKNLDLHKINPNLIKALPVDLRITLTGNANGIYHFKVIEPNADICSYEQPETRSGGHLTRIYESDYRDRYYSYYSYWQPSVEYSIKKAATGNYKIKVNAYNSGWCDAAPYYVRIITFKNFQSKDQVMQVQNVALDNQYGTLEIGQVKW